MLSKSSLLAAVIGFCLLTTMTASVLLETKSAQASDSSAAQEKPRQRQQRLLVLLPTPVTPTTTTLPLPLQPPLNLTSITTTSSFATTQATSKGKVSIEDQGVNNERIDLALGRDVGAAPADSEPSTAKATYLLSILSRDRIKKVNIGNDDEKSEASESVITKEEPSDEELISGSDAIFLPTTSSIDEHSEGEEESKDSTIITPNGHGYIQFQIHDELPVETVKRRERLITKKAATVNEVLTSLFPNGFSDIFRFSYPPDTTTTEEGLIITTSPSPVYEPPIMESSTLATTTTTISEPSAITSSTAPATTAPDGAKNQTYYSYQTTVTKEYRRELKPGHTEIVVEKIARVPRITSEEFNDGSNHISRDELLRINRAAVDAPVLPSLLLKPTEGNESNSDVARRNTPGPIIILNDNDSMEFDESSSIEDNQIAESQHLGQQFYQRSAMPEQRPIESYREQSGPAHEQQINVHIVHDENFAKTQDVNYVQVPTIPQNPTVQSSDLYVDNTEHKFQGQHNAQEAPSRKFLKSFRPTLSDSANGPIPKGVFHYESNAPQQQLNSRPPAPNDYAGPYFRPAAQIAYYREQQATNAISPLHTQIVSSTPSPPSQQVSYDYGPSPPTETQNDVVYVTLNSATPQQTQSVHQVPQHAQPLQEPHLPKPHDYVAEAAAEPSQNQVQHVSPPKSNGYTFVEVQKSVNIHNKLITEKDGRLVEQHETIYHPVQYQKNHFNPKEYVSSAPVAISQPVQSPPKEYVSLSTHPINVAYENEPHESSAIPHSSVHIGSSQPQQEQYQQQQQQQQQVIQHAPHQQATQPVVIEKIVPQPYPLPVEKIVERPVPVIHEVEKHVPHPYPVKEYVEKVVDRPVPVEKVVDRPVKVPYAVPVEHYIDRPYPVKEIVEKHIAIPYAVPEPVAVPVHVEHYIDRPYPVETIVEKPVPYPVETVVEKIVEKRVPFEVERIVEKPVEKMIEKIVDRPVAIPIHVPVAIHMPLPPHRGGFPPHPNALPPWSSPSISHVPPKVLQNYYARMLKKLLPQMTSYKTTTKAPPATTPSKSTQVAKPTRNIGQSPFKLTDIRFDLKPPPPPLSQWLKGSRYIYNTLPADLATAAASQPVQLVKSYIGPVPSQGNTGSAASAPALSSSSNTDFDEFQRWRNGHSLKRSPDFGRNLHLEYGFKPPLVPSVEIDDKGMPLKQEEQ